MTTTQKLHMETGHPVSADVAQVAGDQIRFVNQDGRCLFEIRIQDDQASIEVRAVDTHRAGNKINDNVLVIEPKSCNCITLSSACLLDL
jgi:hypothetical protein